AVVAGAVVRGNELAVVGLVFGAQEWETLLYRSSDGGATWTTSKVPLSASTQTVVRLLEERDVLHVLSTTVDSTGVYSLSWMASSFRVPQWSSPLVIAQGSAPAFDAQLREGTLHIAWFARVSDHDEMRYVGFDTRSRVASTAVPCGASAVSQTMPRVQVGGSRVRLGFSAGRNLYNAISGDAGTSWSTCSVTTHPDWAPPGDRNLGILGSSLQGSANDLVSALTESSFNTRTRFSTRGSIWQSLDGGRSWRGEPLYRSRLGPDFRALYGVSGPSTHH